MPKALVTLPDVYETVSRRVMVDVAGQLARTMRLPGDTYVYLPGLAEKVPMNGGTFGDCCDPGVRYPAQANMTLRFIEEAEEQYTLPTPVNIPEWRPLFQDPVRGVTIRPVYRYMTVQVQFEYNAPNIVVAQRWIDEMRARISMMRAELYQTLEYSYQIPRPVMQLLKEIYDKTEASAQPTGLTFKEYFDEYIMQPYTGGATLINTHEIPLVPEKQYEVLGWFDFTTTPETPQRQDGGNYTTSFVYTLHYNRPMQLFVSYPMLAHNQVIDRLYRPVEPYKRFKEVTRRVTTTKGSFDEFEASLISQRMPYIQHPPTDDWIPDFVPKHVLTFFTGLVVLSTDDRRCLLNLYNMGEYTFTPYFLEYFLQQGDRVFDKIDSIFDFRLYENDTFRSDVKLQFRPGTLTIETDRDLDITRYYHIQISFRRNWYQVSPETLQTLRQYPAVLYASLRALGVFLGGGSYQDLKLMGGSTTGTYPEIGQCSIVGDPDRGGIWPWPWMEPEWAEIGYPGSTWEGPGWPGGGWTDEPWPIEQHIPTWPGDYRIDHTHGCGGVVSNKDLLKAIQVTDDLCGKYIDRRRIGPLMVLFAHIVSTRRSPHI